MYILICSAEVGRLNHKCVIEFTHASLQGMQTPERLNCDNT